MQRCHHVFVVVSIQCGKYVSGIAHGAIGQAQFLMVVFKNKWRLSHARVAIHAVVAAVSNHAVHIRRL